MKVPNYRLRPLSILVVDDYPDSASSLAQVLSLEGFATRFALSGTQALSAAASEPPDVLIVEPRTIGCDWRLARRMAPTSTDRHTLLVVLTSDTTAAGRRAAQAAGAGMYLTKPGNPELLVSFLRNYDYVAGEGPPTRREIRPQRYLDGPICRNTNGLAAM